MRRHSQIYEWSSEDAYAYGVGGKGGWLLKVVEFGKTAYVVGYIINTRIYQGRKIQGTWPYEHEK